MLDKKARKKTDKRLQKQIDMMQNKLKQFIHFRVENNMLKDSITLFQNVNKINDFKQNFDSLNPYKVKSPRDADEESIMQSKST